MAFDINKDWKLLARYFSGDASPEEKAVIEARIDSDSSFREAFVQAKLVWDVTGKPSIGVDKEKAWNSIQTEIRQEGHPKEAMRLIKRDRAPSRRHSLQKSKRRSSTWVFVSAAMIIFLASLYIFRDTNPAEQVSPDVAVFKTTAGQRASVTLPDGSEVMLNAESQLRILTSDSGPARVVQLDGEAFFSVITDTANPFIVRAGEAEVRVVGTSFNVSAYPEQQAVQVLVTEGEVRLGKKGEKEDVTLLENDLGVLPEIGSPSRSRVVSVEKILAWRNGTLVFESASFEEVARTLERWFDLEVRVSGSELADRHLSVTFEDPTPNHAIAIIAKTLNQDYSIQENTVTFFTPERQ